MPDEKKADPKPPATQPPTRAALPGQSADEKRRPMKMGDTTKRGGLLVNVTPC